MRSFCLHLSKKRESHVISISILNLSKNIPYPLNDSGVPEVCGYSQSQWVMQARQIMGSGWMKRY
jgi:hypothetical protein